MYIEAGNIFEDSAAECNNTVSFRFKVQRHLTTDALPNDKGNTDEGAQQESAAEKNLTPPNFPDATGFSRSDANAVAPLHCNSLIAKLPTFPPTVVKSECYGFVYGSFCADPTRNDALTQQL